MLTYSLNIYVLKPYIFPDLGDTVSEKINNLVFVLGYTPSTHLFFSKNPPSELCLYGGKQFSHLSGTLSPFNR